MCLCVGSLFWWWEHTSPLGPRESRQTPTYPSKLYLISFIYLTAHVFLFLSIYSSHMINIYWCWWHMTYHGDKERTDDDTDRKRAIALKWAVKCILQMSARCRHRSVYPHPRSRRQVSPSFLCIAMRQFLQVPTSSPDRVRLRTTIPFLSRRLNSGWRVWEKEKDSAAFQGPSLDV